MEEFIAPLGLKVDATQPAQAAVSLDQLAKAAGRAEGAANDLTDSSKKLSASEKAVADEAKRAMSAVSGLTEEQEALIATQQRLNSLHGTAIGNTKALNQATLNLGRQFTDIGVQLAGGQSPFLVLTQQLPQVADAFAMAKQQGLGFKALIAGMVGQIGPLLATFGPWAAGLAAVGGAVYYVVDQYRKQEKAVKDLNVELTKQRQELEQISPLILNSGHNADLASDGLKNFDTWLKNTNVSLAEQNRLLRENALNKLNDQAMKAAEEYSKAQKAFDKINKGGPSMASSGGPGGFGVVAPMKATDPKNNPFYKEAKENLDIAKASYDAINEYRNKAYLAPEAAFGSQATGAAKAAKAVRDVTTATEDYSRHAAPIYEDQLLKAATVVYPEATAASEAYKKQLDAVRTASNDNIKTMQEQIGPTVHFSSTLEKLAYDLEEAASVSRGLSYDIQDIAYAINRNDWTSAFAGLANVLLQVEAAFAKGATAATKFQAAAGVAQGVGAIVGGSTGAAIGGAASGALAGFTVAGPLGAVAGGILGGIGSLFGSSKAKKRARQQAAAQAAAEEAQRQQTIADYTSQIEIDTLRASGNEGAAVALERKGELDALAKLSPALADLKQKYYDAADAAKAAAEAAEKAAQVDAKRTSIQDEIDKLTLSSSELLAKTRAKERAEAVALDPTLGDLIDKLFGLQDAATAAAEATAKAEADAQAVKDAYDEQARIDAYLAEQTNKVTSAMQEQAAAANASANALAGIVNKFTDLSKTLNELADSLGSELTGATGQAGYAAARARLMGATGEETSDAIKAFLEASKSVSTSSSAYRADVVFAQTLARQRAVEATQTAGFFGSMFSGLPGFADGGSAVIGGNAGVDQNVLSINGQPQLRVGAGELLTVTPRGQASNDSAQILALKEEITALRSEISSMRDDTRWTAKVLKRVSPDGDSLQVKVVT